MKKIATYFTALLVTGALLTSCVKEQVSVNNESYWLGKEQGQVVYSGSYCSYVVVETYYGYNIIHVYGNSKPYEGDIVYGNFSSTGTRDLYNYTGHFVFTATVTDFWLSYYQALDALDYYCPVYGKGTQQRTFKESTIIKN